MKAICEYKNDIEGQYRIAFLKVYDLIRIKKGSFGREHTFYTSMFLT